MDEAGIVRFPGNLDPRAQEFRPRNHHQLTLFSPHPPPPPPPQIYYPYTPSPPPTYTPLSPCGVGYHPFTIRPAYVSVSVSPNTAVATTGGQEALPHPSATPSRTLLLSSVPTDVSESTVQMELEVFGDVRAVQMERVYDGIVTVHFYDLRHAQLALTEIREQHMQQQSRLRNHFINSISGYGVVENCAAQQQQQQPPPLPPPARGLISGRAVWAQFMIPTSSGIPDGLNQGTIVVFNLDSDISSSRLKEIFEAFGSVKELRETPLKRHQKFVEFYDIRDAAKALNEMNGKEIQGKYVVIEFSRPGGHGRRFFNNNSATPTNSQNRIAQPRKLSGRTAYNVPPRSSSSYLCPSMKKNRSGKSSKNSSSILGVEDSMADLCVEEDDGNNSNNGGGVDVSRRNSKKFGNNNNSSSSNNGGVVVSRSRSVKGRLMVKNFDSRFSINEDAILESNCRDSRTTVMIKNIPNKYSLKLLLNMIDNHCIHCNEQIVAASGGDAQPFSAYDFVYLPIDFNNKCNVGYGFVNMTTPEATWRLYKAFHLQSWEVFNSKKICQVTYARVQGLGALKEHFKNSKFPSVTEEIFPVVFTPPRDGRLLTEPLPIYGHAIPPPPTPTVPTTPFSTKSDDDDLDIEGPDFPGETITTEDGGDEVDGGHWVENDDYADDDEEDVGCCRSRSGGDYDEKITVEQALV